MDVESEVRFKILGQLHQFRTIEFIKFFLGGQTKEPLVLKIE